MLAIQSQLLRFATREILLAQRIGTIQPISVGFKLCIAIER
jgi:hypothetical protein